MTLTRHTNLVLRRPATALTLPGTSGNYVSTPNTPAFNISGALGDLELRCRVALDNWNTGARQYFLSKRGTNTGYAFDINAAGGLELMWGTGSANVFAGSAFTAPAPGAAKWFRATLDVDDGAGNRVRKLYDGDDGETWNLINTLTTAGTTTIGASTSPVELGSGFAGTERLAGKLYYADVRVIGGLGNGVTVVHRGVDYSTHNPEKSWSFQPFHSATNDYDRFEVRSGDVWVSDAASVERTEVRSIGDALNLPFDSDIWLSFAMRVPASTTLNPAGWLIAGQMHGADGRGNVPTSPVWVQEFYDTSVFRVVTRSDPNTVSEVNPSPVTRYEDTNFPRDTWVRFVYQLRFARTGNGYIRAWRDGTEIVNATIPMGYNDTLGPYFKYGAYRAAWTGTAIIEYANMELATRSLAERVTSPLALPSTPAGITLVGSFDATAIRATSPLSPTSYLDPQGRRWTVNGSAWDWAHAA